MNASKVYKVVYTCITGGYDDLIQHHHINDDWDYVCFTDNADLLAQKRIGQWDISPLQYAELDNIRNARWHKTHPHLLFPDHVYSIWIDANFDVRSDLLFRQVSKCIAEDVSLSIAPHRERQCVYDEIRAVRQRRRDNDEIIRKHKELLMSEGMPEGYGLWETSILFRKHHDSTVAAMMNEWFGLIKAYSRRDQLSLSYVLWKHNYTMRNLSPKNEIRGNNKHFILHYGAAHTGFEPLKSLSLVISVCQNSLADVQCCLKSIKDSHLSDAVDIIIIVDDDSTQETAELLLKNVENQAQDRVFRNEQKLGYIKSCNKGIAEAKGDIVILLSPDTMIPQDFEERVLACFNADLRVGLASPLASESDLWHLPPRQGESFEEMDNRVRERLKSYYPTIVCPEGFCFCIRRDLIEEIGALEEIYDKRDCAGVDFSLHALSKGWRSVLIGDLYLSHKGDAHADSSEGALCLDHESTLWSRWRDLYDKQMNMVRMPLVKEKILSKLYIDPRNAPAVEAVRKERILGGLCKKRSSSLGKREIFFCGIKVWTYRKKWIQQSDVKLLVHIHLYYHDQLDYFLEKLRNITIPFDLYVTLVDSSDLVQEKLLAEHPRARIIKVEDRGYDVYPFLQVLKNSNLKDYDYVLKLHTKSHRSEKASINSIPYEAYDWRDDLIDPLIGSKFQFNRNISRLAKNSQIGLMASQNLLLRHECSSQVPQTRRLAEQLGYQYCVNAFVAGRMFIIKANILHDIVNYPYTSESYHADNEASSSGSLARSMETFFGILVTENFLRIKGVHSWKTLYKSLIYQLNWRNMIYRKEKSPNGRRRVYLLGVKILSYKPKTSVRSQIRGLAEKTASMSHQLQDLKQAMAAQREQAAHMHNRVLKDIQAECSKVVKSIPPPEKKKDSPLCHEFIFYWDQVWKEYLQDKDSALLAAQLKEGTDHYSHEYVDTFLRLIDLLDYKKHIYLADGFGWTTKDAECTKRAQDYMINHKVTLKQAFMQANQYGLIDIYDTIFDKVNGRDIIDGGAYDGNTALLFHQMFPQSKIYSFEPLESTYRSLESCVKKHGLEAAVTCLQAGLGNEEGTFNLHIRNEGDAGATVTTHRPDNTTIKEIKIMTLDTVDARLNLNVGLIKLDVEGFEKNVLEGSRHVIERDKPVIAAALYHNPVDFFEIKGYLQSIHPDYQFMIRRSENAIPLGDIILIAY